MSAPALRFEALSKQFGGVHALRDVILEIAPGEVHGLLGENGSGKSTLIKILAGFHEPEPGARLSVGGHDVPLPIAPGQFRELGISFVHQDLGLVPSLTVTENLRVEDLASSWSWGISWRRERRRARAVFEAYGVDLDPAAEVESLSPVERALLAIVRAVERVERRGRAGDGDAPLLVLDEPTVFLPRTGVRQLFALIRTIVDRGSSVLFVSHDLDEIREITDRVTVLRDGRVQGTIATADASELDLIEMIVGRRFLIAEAAHEHVHIEAGRRLSAELNAPDGAAVRIDLGAGEILGLTGLVGSGFERVPYVLFGAERASGRIEIDGASIDLDTMTPQRALSLGFVLLPANRQRDGSIGELPLGENVMLPVLDRYRRGLRLRRREMLADAGALLGRFDVRPNEPRLSFDALSGGNQQKAMLAKWLQIEPKVLLLHEPTQGVDVGAREQVYTIIREAVNRGASVVCASSDYEQLARLCDRVLIFARGRVASELRAAEVDKATITERCFNSLTLGRPAA